MNCAVCGKGFADKRGKFYCSQECKLYRNEKPKKEKALPTQDRPYTKDTVMLVIGRRAE